MRAKDAATLVILNREDGEGSHRRRSASLFKVPRAVGQVPR